MTEFQPSDLRIGDAERESAMTALGEHMSAGRLTLDEYGDRSAQVSTAKTRGELLALFHDLPQPHPNLTGVPQPAAPAPGFPPASGFPAGNITNQQPRVPQRSLFVRSLPVLVPAVAVVAIASIVVTHLWIFILLPILVMVIGRSAGDRARHEQQRQRELERRAARERWRDERRDFKYELKHQIRQQIRDSRRNSRGW